MTTPMFIQEVAKTLDANYPQKLNNQDLGNLVILNDQGGGSNVC